MNIANELNSLVNKIIFNSDLDYLFEGIIQIEDESIALIKNGNTSVHAIRCKLNSTFQFKNYWFFINFSFKKDILLIQLNFKGFINLDFYYNYLDKTISYDNENISLNDLIQIINKKHKDNQINLFNMVIESKIQKDENLLKNYQNININNAEELFDFIKLIDMTKY